VHLSFATHSQRHKGTSPAWDFPQWTNQTWLGNPALIHDDFPVAIKPLPLVMTSSLLLKMAIEIVDLPIINADVPCFSD